MRFYVIIASYRFRVNAAGIGSTWHRGRFLALIYIIFKKAMDTSKDTNKYDITKWGLTDRFAALAAAAPEYSVGRVLSQEKGLYRIVCGQGVQLASVSGKLRYGAASVSDFPAVGDFVMLGCGDGGSQAVIHSVLPRKSVFIRKAAGTSRTEQVVAANVDTVFICMSLNRDFNLRRLERYLSAAWDSGAAPVIVLTKADLCEDIAAKRADAESVAFGADIIVTSGLAEDGHDALTPYMAPGRTVAFIGSSGVGKSTLINRLLGEEKLSVNGLRDDDRGRHTTTHRELIMLPCGCMVMDTPGMRELGMWDVDEGLERAFADIEELASRCRFGDCTHTGEPGCAVRAAIRDGSLSDERWRSYQKLCAESAYAENSESYLSAKSQKFREIAKINKNGKKTVF